MFAIGAVIWGYQFVTTATALVTAVTAISNLNEDNINFKPD
jgi:hypothetical protein